jgi:predicted dehydrogenase
MISVGVIGYGYWGPNLVRNFVACPDTEVAMVCDLDKGRLSKVAALYPAIRLTTSATDLIADPAVDAVVISTPVDSHFPLAMAALKAGKHVLVEKPIASTVEEATKLIEEADSRGLVLAVDHTFIFTSAVRKMFELVRSDAFGPVRYYDSTRVNLGLFQHDVNVLWDLAVHDLSIMQFALDQRPVAVSATGQSLLPGQPEYAAFLTVFFGSSTIAHVNVNWLSPVKIRRTLIGGDQQMVVYDDLEAIEKIKLYDKGIVIRPTSEQVHKLLISYRTGDLWSPNLPVTEALAVEAAHFAACVRREEQPIASGEKGLEIVRILEAANRSMRGRGTPVELSLQP